MDGTGSTSTAVAAHLRRLPAVESITAGRAGSIHVTVKTWHRTMWLIDTWAFKPLAIQCWYSAEKSAAVTDGCDPVQAGVTPHASPLTTSANMGWPWEVEG